MMWGIDHGGLDVFVPQERLTCPQVGPRLQKVCGEAMPKRMDAGVFDDGFFGQRVIARSVPFAAKHAVMTTGIRTASRPPVPLLETFYEALPAAAQIPHLVSNRSCASAVPERGVHAMDPQVVWAVR